MAAVAHDRTATDGMWTKSLPLGCEKSVFFTNRPVVFDIAKIDNELRPDGADLSMRVDPQGGGILLF